MNKLRRFFTASLVVLIAMPQIANAGLKDTIRYTFYAGLGATAATLGLRGYNSLSHNNKLEDLKTLNKSFENQPIHYDDKVKDIKEKWSMKDWRTKTQMGQTDCFPTAHEICGNRDRVYKAIYDDMERGLIYIINTANERIDFTTFEKPDKNYMLSVLSDTKKVPTHEKLEAFHDAIVKELKQMEEVKKRIPFAKQLEDLFLSICKSFVKGEDKTLGQNYAEFRQKIQAKPEKTLFEKELLQSSQNFLDTKDIRYTYIFNKEQLNEIKKVYLAEAKIDSIKKAYWKKNIFNLNLLINDTLESLSNSIELINDSVSSYVDVKKIIFNKELQNKVFNKSAQVYFNWMVKYVRLSALKDVARALVLGKNKQEKAKDGVKSEITQKRQMVQKEIDIITNKIQLLLNRLTDHEDKDNLSNNDLDLKNNNDSKSISYVNLHKVHASIDSSWRSIKYFVEQDMIITTEFKSLAGNLVSTILQELKTLAQNGTSNRQGGFAPDRFNQLLMDNDEVKMPAKPLFEKGTLTSEGRIKLENLCETWIKGLRYLKSRVEEILKYNN